MDEGAKQLLAVLLYFGGYIAAFFIVKSLMLNNALMGSVAKNISAFGQNWRGNQAKKRAGIQAENTARMKTGSRFSGRNAATRAFNTTTMAAGTGLRGRFGMGTRGKEAMDAASRVGAADFMKSPQYAALQEDDNALRAMTYRSAADAKTGLKSFLMAGGKSDEEAEQESNRAVNAVLAGPRFGRAQQVAAAQGLVNTGTGYKDIQDASETIARASSGNVSTGVQLAGYTNAISKQKGRHDLAPGAGSLIESVRHDMNDRDATGTPISAPSASELKTKAWNSGSLYQISNGKGAATKTFAEHWVQQYQTAAQQAQRTGDWSRVEQAEIAKQELSAMLPNATGDNQVIINDALRRMSTIEASTAPPTLAPGVSGPPTAARAAYETMRQTANQKARTYQRPDLNNIT